MIELWDESDDFVVAVYNSLCRFRRVDNVIWGNRFNGLIQAKCKVVDSSVPTISNAVQWIGVYLAYYVGVLPFLPLSSIHFDVFAVVLINEKLWSKLFGGSIRGVSEKNLGRFEAFLYYLFCFFR